MPIQLPGSVLSRALRSRLIQQRLPNTHTYRFAKGIAPVTPRLYSTADAPADETLPNHEHETSHAPARPIDGYPGGRRAFTPRAKSRTFGPKAEAARVEGQMLMAIASGASPGADADATAASPGAATISRKTIEMELKWLEDPRALADRVSRILQSGDPAKAAALVRQAQKSGKKCDVAWNNLLQYCMDRGHAQAAFKFYNDMKKRGRMPNARTYTIMLKGFSNAPRARGIVKTAHSVYRSIFAKNSPVQPNIIHTNAMLAVCQRHGDIDLLWRIAGDLPEEGPEAPDMTTYSTILGALQYAARSEIEKMNADEIDRILERKEQMVKEGKRIWADVIYRWTHEKLPLDNHVVNAMASLLLDGANDRDFYDVFALYYQTMGIPILSKIPPENPKAARRRVAFEKRTEQVAPHEVEDVPFVDANNKLLRRDKKDTSVEDEEEENFDSLFDPVVPGNEDLSYLQPANKELTLLLDACLNMTQGASTGSAYWEHLTQKSTTHRIDPDMLSFVQYLRLLRITRSSRLAARLMREQMLPSGQATGKAFHIALSCCRRDRRNLRVLIHANELLDLMQQALVLPDPRVLEGYLDLVQALSDTPHILLHLGGLDIHEKKSKTRSLQTLGKELQAKLRLRALQSLRPHYTQLHEAMEHGKPGPKTRWSSANEGNGAIFGQPCVKIMARIRTLIDETLKVEYMLFVDKAERKLLEADSGLLKVYSDKKTIERFTQMLVFPTVEQRNAFQERVREVRGEMLPGREEGVSGVEAKLDEVAESSTEAEADVAEVEGNRTQIKEDLPEAKETLLGIKEDSPQASEVSTAEVKENSHDVKGSSPEGEKDSTETHGEIPGSTEREVGKPEKQAVSPEQDTKS